jgi:hypothetical protein
VIGREGEQEIEIEGRREQKQREQKRRGGRSMSGWS